MEFTATRKAPTSPGREGETHTTPPPLIPSIEGTRWVTQSQSSSSLSPRMSSAGSTLNTRPSSNCRLAPILFLYLFAPHYHFAHSSISSLSLIVHGNYNAPMEDALQRGIKVLDVGCGSGRWTLDMAKDYPASDFTGTDIAHAFLKTNVPPNCKFIQVDTLKGLPFPDNTFDYVFQRLLWSSFSRADWDVAVREFIRVTKTGGWIELFELDPKFERSGVTHNRIMQAFETLCKSRDIDLTLFQRLDTLLTPHLESVHSDYATGTIGWRGHVGQLLARNQELVGLHLMDKLAPELGVTKEKYKQLVAKAVAELADNKAWYRMPYVYGKKPINYTTSSTPKKKEGKGKDKDKAGRDE
ncbi:S-adenosyl-L-methionine-dependent methyltransferase [Endogone sp. FLAS-F59071]|nr:S-adenosyl-L-methionine-dependent methyltransferase [Endogone sp. FLAS-F59071]|eukprot:RUS18044.1 S-adenosyl-L-methionine-dependent methyltransferase [Endogone sp. FLAS-F59071]